jgi:hypothetical protein
MLGGILVPAQVDHHVLTVHDFQLLNLDDKINLLLKAF